MSSTKTQVPSKAELALAAHFNELLGTAPFLTDREIAGIYRVSVPTVHRMKERGEIETVRFGRALRFKNPLLATSDGGPADKGRT
jgi:excisionase family DNA binding protein